MRWSITLGKILEVFTGFFINPFLLLIGIPVFFGARAEHLMVQQQETLSGHFVHEAMETDQQMLNGEAPVGFMIPILQSTCTDFFEVSEKRKI